MKIKRLLSLCVCFSCTLFAVICSNPSVALADESSDIGEIEAYIESNEYYQEFDLTPLSALEEDDYTGSVLFQVLSQRASMYFQYQGFTFKDQGYSKAEGNYMGAYKLPVYLTIGFQVERGHTYSGSVQLTGSTSASLDSDFMYQMDSDQCYVGSFVFSGYDEVSPESVDVSVYPVLVAGSEADYTININFNNYQSTFDGYVYVNLTLHFDLATIIYSSNNPWWVQRSVAVVNTHASDWAGTLKDYPTNAIVDSEGSLIANQTQQQQQIAQQQQQQSQQQHEEMTDKVEESTNIIDKGLDRLGNTILDGIKSFFIPSNEYFTALFDDLKVWFEERMGLLSAPLVFLLDILGMFTGTVPMGEITLPAIGFGDIWISQPMTFRLSDYPVIETLQGYCHIATNIMMTLWVIELFQKKEKEVLHS